MSSWIDDARRHADEKRRHDQERLTLEQSRMKQEQQLRQVEGQKLLHLFRAKTEKTKLEIESVLAGEQLSGLLIEGPMEGYLAEVGNFCTISETIGDDRDGYMPTTKNFSWVYGWTVTEISSGQKLNIYLGLKVVSVDRGWVFKSLENQYIPTTSALQVEQWIKSWLYEIFSR